MKITPFFQFIVVATMLLTQNNNLKIELEKYLENIKQTIKKIKQLQSIRQNQKKHNERKKLRNKKQIKKQLFQKLTLPYVLQPRDYIIHIHKEKSKNDLEKINNEFYSRFVPDKKSNFQHASSPLSSAIEKFFKENHGLFPFKFPAIQQLLKKLKNPKLSAQYHQAPDTTVGNLDKRVKNIQVYHWVEELKDWYIEILENARKFWVNFYQMMMLDKKTFEYLKNNYCRDLLNSAKANLHTPQWFFISKDFVNTYISNPSPLTSGDYWVFYPLNFPFVEEVIKRRDCNDYENQYPEAKQRFPLRKDMICKAPILLQIIGECRLREYGVILDKCIQSVLNFHTNQNYITNCSAVNRWLLRRFFNDFKEWFNIAKKLFILLTEIYMETREVEKDKKFDISAGPLTLLYTYFIKEHYKKIDTEAENILSDINNHLLKTLDGQCYIDSNLKKFIESESGFSKVYEKILEL